MEELRRKKTQVWILNGVVAIMVVVLFFAVMYFADEVYSTATPIYDGGSFRRVVLSDDYSDLVWMYHTNASDGLVKDDWMEKYYALAEYYHEAVQYKMYVKLGDDSGVEKYAAKMQETIQEMGELGVAAPVIDRRLGIER